MSPTRGSSPSGGPAETPPSNNPFRDLIQQFLANATHRPYLENTAWLLGERFLRLTIGLSVGVYVVRYLGPRDYGELAYAVSFVGLFVAIATLGLPGIVVRELVRDSSRRGEILGTALGLNLAGSLLTIGLVSALAPLTGATRAEQWLILIISAGMLADSFKVIDLYFQSIAQSRYVVQIQVVQLILSSLIKLVLIWNHAELIWFAVVAIVDSLVIAGGLILNYRRAQASSPERHRQHRRCQSRRDTKPSTNRPDETYPIGPRKTRMSNSH